jgi:hypothetical protein
VRVLVPPINVLPSSLTLSYKLGTSAPAPQTLAVINSAGVSTSAVVTSGATWLTVSSSSTPSAADFSVTIHPASLAPAAYTGNIRFSASNGSVDVPVYLTVVSCVNGLSSPGTAAQVSGGSSSFNVNAPVGRSWTATSDVSWISLTSGATGNGPGTVTFQTAPNTGPARTGTITVSGNVTFTVTQTAPSGPLPGLRFQPVPPCRIADTRNSTGPFGGPAMTAHATRSFTLSGSNCGIPGTASAYSLNVTAVPFHGLSYLTLWPTGQSNPLVSTLNSFDGRTKANAAIVPAGINGAISVFVTDDTEVVLDINGYFGPPGGSDALSFYPVTSCRISDTRLANGTFGGPILAAGGNSHLPHSIERLQHPRHRPRLLPERHRDPARSAVIPHTMAG